MVLWLEMIDLLLEILHSRRLESANQRYDIQHSVVAHHFHKHLLVSTTWFLSLYFVAKALSAVIAAVPTNVAVSTATIAIYLKFVFLSGCERVMLMWVKQNQALT
jgi:hypothetical protein